MKRGVISLHLTAHVHPRAGQTVEEAEQEMYELLTEFLTQYDNGLMDTYGATATEVEQAVKHDDFGDWDGHEGPFLENVSVSSRVPRKN